MLNISKTVQIELYLQWQTDRKSYMIYRMLPFVMTFKRPLTLFQGHAIIRR